MAPWVYAPHSGGTKMTPITQAQLLSELRNYCTSRPWYPKIQLSLRFKSQFCYVDSTDEGDERIFPLCRLRYFRDEHFSLALFSYGNERYEPCLFANGKDQGTLTEAIETCEPFII